MTSPRCYAKSNNVLLTVNTHELNGTLFLSTTTFFGMSLFSSVLKFVAPFTTLYASLYSHKSDLSIGGLKLIFLLTEYCPFDKSFTLIHFLVINFDTVELINNLDILRCYFLLILYICLNSINIFCLFSSKITSSLTFIEFSSGICFGFTIFPTIFFLLIFLMLHLDNFFGSRFCSI